MRLRSRSKATVVVPRAAVKTEPRVITPPTAADDVDLSETALRKLPRVELQKLAKAHRVKANIKSELIIRHLSGLKIPKKGRPAKVDPNPESQQAGPSGVEPLPVPYDKDLFSSTESEMTEEEQLDYATPISSRSETPPLANTKDLERCVKIMQEISTQDLTLLNGVTDVRTTAVKLRKRARDVRELVKAETGRRERMEAYFRYWQETEPRWDRRWLYGEKMVPDYKLQLEELDGPAGPPTMRN